MQADLSRCDFLSLFLMIIHDHERLSTIYFDLSCTLPPAGGDTRAFSRVDRYVRRMILSELFEDMLVSNMCTPRNVY